MKKGLQNKPAFRLAFCSVLAAVETVLMLLTGFVRVGTYAVPCLAGMLTVAAVIEYNCKWGFGVFAVTAALSFFLSGDKEAVVLFVAFFGYYPVVKNLLERFVKNAVLRWVLKFALFNAAVVGSFFIALNLLAVPASEFELFGVYMPLVFLLLGNIFFFIYDLTINAVVRFYAQRIRPAVFGKKQ